jgi:hypothetical protein
MIWLHPSNVSFAGTPLGRVESVAVDWRADSLIVDYGDAGPYTQFVDVPRQRATITIERELAQAEPSTIRPSQQGTLAFEVGPSQSSAGRRRITTTAVIVAVEHSVSNKRGMVQKIQAIAVSTTGAADPIVETPVGEGEGS